jgi:hypothetical protein
VLPLSACRRAGRRIIFEALCLFCSTGNECLFCVFGVGPGYIEQNDLELFFRATNLTLEAEEICSKATRVLEAHGKDIIHQVILIHRHVFVAQSAAHSGSDLSQSVDLCMPVRRGLYERLAVECVRFNRYVALMNAMCIQLPWEKIVAQFPASLFPHSVHRIKQTEEEEQGEFFMDDDD